MVNIYCRSVGTMYKVKIMNELEVDDGAFTLMLIIIKQTNQFIKFFLWIINLYEIFIYFPLQITKIIILSAWYVPIKDFIMWQK